MSADEQSISAARRVTGNVLIGLGGIALIGSAAAKLLSGDLVRQVRQINGAPALVSYLHGRPHSVLCFNIAGGEICNIYIVSNPDKLTRLPALSSSS
jgi:hypothetical protein